MGLAELASEIAGQSDAVVTERSFQERAIRGSTCRVDLRSIPEDAAVISVDKLVNDDAKVRSAVESTCSCGYRRGELRHRQCDYVVICDFQRPHWVLIEVKSGTSNQARDVTKGFEQLVCSKVALMSLLDRCNVNCADASIVGVVVSPATYLQPEHHELMRAWSRKYRIRLTQTLCGSDVWDAAFGLDE